MSDRLQRFRRLERARQASDPDDASAPVAGPVSGRFAAIEPRAPRGAPTHDPFAPPPESTRELQLAHESTPTETEAQLQKAARAEAALQAAEAELAQARAARQARGRASVEDRAILAILHAAAGLGTGFRLLLIAALAVAAMIGADAIGPGAWVLGGLPFAVIAASFFVTPGPR